MKIKRILTAFLAVAISATALSAISPIEAGAEDYGTAFVMFQNGMDAQAALGDVADAVSPTITGDGSYTASVPISSPAETILLLLLQTDILDTEYPDAKITVDSVLFDGEKIEYTQSEDAFTMEDNAGYRVNIFNEWGNDVKDIDNKVAVESSIEINFTVSGLAAGSAESTTAAETTAAGETTTAADETTKAGDTTTKAGDTTTKAATTTKATATTTKTADGTPSTGTAGIVGIVALAGLASAGAFIARKKK